MKTKHKNTTVIRISNKDMSLIEKRQEEFLKKYGFKLSKVKTIKRMLKELEKEVKL